MTKVRKNTNSIGRHCRRWEQLSKIHPDYLEFLPEDENQNFQSQIKSLQRKQRKCRIFVPTLSFRTIVYIGIMTVVPLSAASAMKFVFRTSPEKFLNSDQTTEQDFEQKLTQLSEALSIIVSAVKRHEVALADHGSGKYKQTIVPSPITSSLPPAFREENSVASAAVPITVNVSNARLRTAPVVSSDIVATLDKGTDLLATRVENGWILVTAPTGQDAWIRKELISVKALS